MIVDHSKTIKTLIEVARNKFIQYFNLFRSDERILFDVLINKLGETILESITNEIKILNFENDGFPNNIWVRIRNIHEWDEYIKWRNIILKNDVYYVSDDILRKRIHYGLEKFGFTNDLCVCNVESDYPLYQQKTYYNVKYDVYISLNVNEWWNKFELKIN